MVYYPVRQRYRSARALIVRHAPGATGMPALIRRTMLDIDPQLSLDRPYALQEYTAVGLLPQRIGASIASALGVLALLLSAIGVYGVIAYTVAQRTREIGVRVALGARRSDVASLILAGGLRLALPGLAIGTLLALGLGQLVRGFILGVPPADPVTFVAMPALLLCAVVLASLAPARRASSIEPLQALRSE